MSEWRVPFNRPSLTGRELDYIREAVDRGHISGDGVFTRRCEERLERLTGAHRAMLTPSCTAALELTALLLDVGQGDEVVVPSFTFVSSAGAFALRGASVVFADVRPDTLNLDEELLPDLLSARTRAVVAVHYAGVACELDEITALLGERGVALVEDNAHGLTGSYRGRPLGSFGTFAAQSFHETKNVTCGEGGALLVNEPAYVARAEILREKGTDRKRFFRGEIDRYTWVDVGSSVLLSDVAAAFLAAQLEEIDQIQAARRGLWERYERELRDWASRAGVRLPVAPADRRHAYHMFHLLLPTANDRDRLIAHLKSRGILAVFHYQPLHLSAVGRAHGGRKGLCPVAEDVAERLVRLPFYTAMTGDEQDEVIDALHGWR